MPKSIVSLGAADFNHDGKQDLVVGSADGIGVMLGNGDGTFQLVSALRKGPSHSLFIADLNKDGNPDVVGLEETLKGAVVIYFGDGQGIGVARNIAVGGGNTEPSSSNQQNHNQLAAEPDHDGIAESGKKIRVNTTPTPMSHSYIDGVQSWKKKV